MNEENERESGGWMVERVNQEELMIRREEMRAAMMRTKSGKADGPDDIPAKEMSRRESSGPFDQIV